MSITTIDALVVGAGFGGIYQAYTLRELGLTVMVIDTAPAVGGTWYWNRYPGAMSDTESYLYRYSWDTKDLRESPWTHHYLRQPEILAYLNRMVDKHQLRKTLQLNTTMLGASWNDEAQVWHVETTKGAVTAGYLITALGLLSKPNYPDIPGIDNFEGLLTHTASWNPNLDLSGKRVGIIGNGSTGTQVMTAVAPIVGELISFQRHPQYSVPAGNRPVSPEYRKWVNENYDDIWDQAFKSATAFGFVESTRPTMSVSSEERERIFQELWDRGNGFHFMFGGFGDITTSEEANEEAAKFIRRKIGQIVKDPETAKKLQPSDLYARRPLCDSGYYNIFNRDNVKLVDLRENAIESIVADGIQMADGSVHALDVLIFATGFDAIDGNYIRMSITGKKGASLKEHWEDGCTSFLGVAVSGFPNFFTVLGPQGPFCNNPPAIESQVDFISAAIGDAEAKRRVGTKAVLDLSEDTEREWGQLCDRLTDGSLFKRTESWIFGTNIAGKKQATKFYFGGLGKWRETAQEVIQSGFRQFYRCAPAVVERSTL
ncbi:FAD/NAD(P)-binding domain-containing protein [Lophiostoma macrostomum CBS 122681]|uniref:FAD/NAD(P)-binding domain-containing protein n=1 Tax=Lophiostoma macrostomum CBS 122681 TaxID=1314788 RepID=A0A6A6T2W1_9PLEO|nr:FAD/NAD(P)-binding domain-containing protein [Lophiostoma macrostomum CBS 122681]